MLKMETLVDAAAGTVGAAALPWTVMEKKCYLCWHFSFDTCCRDCFESVRFHSIVSSCYLGMDQTLLYYLDSLFPCLFDTVTVVVSFGYWEGKSMFDFAYVFRCDAFASRNQ